jgi:hypothetical protein
MLTPPKISIVMPARNEAANLRVVLPELPAVHEVILVDGGSVDETVATAQDVRPEIKILQQTRRGKGNALVCGFTAATGDIVVMFDADGSADPHEIPRFVETLVAGADYAKGTRFCRWGAGEAGSDDISPLRRVGNAGLNTVGNALFRTRFSDLCYGYNAFWREILPLLHLPPVSVPEARPGQLLWGDGFEIEAVLSCRVAAARLRITEVPSLERRRIHGESNLRTFADGTRVLRTLLTERATVGRRSSTMQPVAISAGPPSEPRADAATSPAVLSSALAGSEGGPHVGHRRHAAVLRPTSSVTDPPRAFTPGRSRSCAGRKGVDHDS